MEYIKNEDDYQKEFNDQIQLLLLDCQAFDSGYPVKAKEIANRLRLLLHDTKKQVSLLSRLKIKDRNTYIDTYRPEDQVAQVKMGHYGLTLRSMRNNHLIPQLDDFIDQARGLPFNEWWGGKVCVDGKGNVLTRKELVLTLANKDGGVHVDNKLPDETYTAMSKFNSMGLFYSCDGKNWLPSDVLGGSIRQIAHELLKSLNPNYTCSRPEVDDIFIADVSIGVSSDLGKSKKKVGRNAPCPCGSGKKNKKCCKVSL